MTIRSQRNSDEAFADAIRSGVLNDDIFVLNNHRAAADHMYMWTETSGNGLIDVFKHVGTREYIVAPVTVL